MELFRVIKDDAKRAMRFCGGRSVSSAIIIVLVCLLINIAETVFLIIFSEPENIFESIVLYSKEDIAITAGAAFLWLLIIPALLLGYKKLHFSFAEFEKDRLPCRILCFLLEGFTRLLVLRTVGLPL